MKIVKKIYKNKIKLLKYNFFYKNYNEIILIYFKIIKLSNKFKNHSIFKKKKTYKIISKLSNRIKLLIY